MKEHKTEDTADTVEVVFVRGGVTLGDQVHCEGTRHRMPRALALMTAAEQVADYRAAYWRLATEEDALLPWSHETYLVPRAEHAQLTSALLTVQEVMKILRVTKDTVLAMIRKNLLTAAKLDPTTETSPWRIRRSSLVRFLDDGLMGDEERDLLGRAPRLLGSVDTNLDARGGALLGTATTVVPNQALESWEEEEDATEDEE